MDVQDQEGYCSSFIISQLFTTSWDQQPLGPRSLSNTAESNKTSMPGQVIITGLNSPSPFVSCRGIPKRKKAAGISRGSYKSHQESGAMIAWILADRMASLLPDPGNTCKIMQAKAPISILISACQHFSDWYITFAHSLTCWSWKQACMWWAVHFHAAARSLEGTPDYRYDQLIGTIPLLKAVVYSMSFWRSLETACSA